MLNNTFNIKKNIQFYLQATKTRQSSDHANEGFTLIELLIATSIMSIVVTFAGFGVVAMLQQNKTSASETDRRANLNRALDYIANEVRMAKSIKTSASSSDNLILPSDFNIPPNTNGLVLTFPDNTKSVYFLAPSDKKSTCNKTTSLWQCPFAIFRAKGTYPSGSTTPIPSDDVKMLVDGLQIPATSIPLCSGVSTTPYSSSTTTANFYGFYACISNSRQVVLSLYGKLIEKDDSTPIPLTPTVTDPTTLKVETTAVIRAK
jgi:prepilin-type N-terminal cleavage/methylation domain-containing protein